MKPEDAKEKPKKPEVKKLEDMLPFNPFDVLGLRPKKIDEKYKKYVGLNKRMMASTIDTIIAALTIAPILDWVSEKYITTHPVSMEEISAASSNPGTEIHDLTKLLVESGKLSEYLLGTTLQMFALLLASAICWKLWSATPGKILLRMRIVDVDTDQPISDKQILLRSLGYIPSCAVFFLGIFWISFNKRHQGWHDKIAHTAVITIPKKKKIAQELPDVIEGGSDVSANSSSNI